MAIIVCVVNGVARRRNGIDHMQKCARFMMRAVKVFGADWQIDGLSMRDDVIRQSVKSLAGYKIRLI